MFGLVSKKKYDLVFKSWRIVSDKIVLLDMRLTKVEAENMELRAKLRAHNKKIKPVKNKSNR